MEEELKTEASEKDLELARDIIRTITKAVKTFNVYPKDNPIYQKFAAELFEKFNSFFEANEDLSIDIGPYSLLYKGNEVFYSEERTDNIALLLFADGIRHLNFFKGLTFDEIIDFIDILRLAPKSDADDDDIVTLLWEKNIKNMGYSAVEDTVDDSLAVEKKLFQEDVAEIDAEGASASGTGHAGLLKRASGGVEAEPLTNEELLLIKAEFSELEENPLLSSAVGLYFELLSNVKEAEVFPEIMQNLWKIIDIRMKGKDIKGALEILNKIKTISALYHDPGQKDVINSVFRKAGNLENLRILFSEISEEGDISTYLFLLGEDSVPDMIEMLGELQERKQRRFLCEILAEIGRRNINVFSEAITDERWFLARNIAMILGMIKEPAAVQYLEKLSTHPNSKVRREAVRALDAIHSDDTKKLFLAALTDDDLGVRMTSLRALRRFKDIALFNILKESASREELKKKIFEEKREVLETLAVLGGERAFPLLADLFKKKGLIEKEDITEIRAAAAYGLGIIKTPEAISLIEKETGSRKDILREACMKALKESQRVGNVRK